MTEHIANIYLLTIYSNSHEPFAKFLNPPLSNPTTIVDVMKPLSLEFFIHTRKMSKSLKNIVMVKWHKLDEEIILV